MEVPAKAATAYGLGIGASNTNTEAEKQMMPPHGSAPSTVAGAQENNAAGIQAGAEGSAGVVGVTTPDIKV